MFGVVVCLLDYLLCWLLLVGVVWFGDTFVCILLDSCLLVVWLIPLIRFILYWWMLFA